MVTSATLLVLWELTARSGILPPQVPPLSDVCVWLWGQFGKAEFWASVWDTVSQWAVGLAIGTVAGIVVGATLGLVPLLRDLLQGTFEFLRPIPSIIYLPIFLLVLGATPTTAFTLVAVACFWPVLFQAYYGVLAIDPVALDTGKAFNLTLRQRTQHIVAHSISPFVATGIRISSTLGLIAAVSIEMVGGIPGIGADLSIYAINGLYDGVYGFIVVAGVLGLLINFVFENVERRLLSWHVSHRGVAQ